MSIQIPSWAKKLGMYGIVVFVGYLFIKFAIDVIFQAEIENWWMAYARPWLVSKEELRFELFGWQILLLGSLIAMFVISIPIIYKHFSRNQNPLEQFKNGKIPQHIDTTSLTTSDLVSAIVSTRNGKMRPEDLSNLVVSALNSALINKETAAKTLTEFGYNLIYLGDNKFTISKMGVSNE